MDGRGDQPSEFFLIRKEWVIMFCTVVVLVILGYVVYYLYTHNFS